MTAPAELVIEVTAEDIAKDAPRECMWCPIAYAARRALGWPLEPSHGLEVTGDGGVHVIVIPGTGKWLLPREASTFISHFDTGMPVAPITFTARLAGES